MDTLPLRPRAFTLIEALCTVLILSVVTALVLPSLSGAKRAARGAACFSNLRSLGFGIATYASEHRALLPHATEPADLREGLIAPFDTLADQLLISPPARINDVVYSDQPFRCPADATFARTLGTSYRYVPADFMRIPEIWGGRPQVGVTRLYEAGPEDMPLLVDLDRFHGPRSLRSSAQALFYSQAVRRLPE